MSCTFTKAKDSTACKCRCYHTGMTLPSRQWIQLRSLVSFDSNNYYRHQLFDCGSTASTIINQPQSELHGVIFHMWKIEESGGKIFSFVNLLGIHFSALLPWCSYFCNILSSSMYPSVVNNIKHIRWWVWLSIIVPYFQFCILLAF